LIFKLITNSFTFIHFDKCFYPNANVLVHPFSGDWSFVVSTMSYRCSGHWFKFHEHFHEVHTTD